MNVGIEKQNLFHHFQNFIYTQMWKDIHILLLGEPGVGKTSLILALVTEDFPEDVPSRVEEITIPAEVTPEKVPTYIVDYSESEQVEYQLCEEIGRANVICLVYDLSDLSTLDQVRKRWLPLIREYNMHESSPPPIILVGTKSDLINDSKVYEAMPIMGEFAEIETCIECSAKTMNNVSEMFYFAQKAVLHPTGPLYSPQDGYLKAESRMALTRVFKICDIDNDGVLSDEELNSFQTICFNAPLPDQALVDVKNVVKKNCRGRGVDANGCLTLEGFLYLHLLFIQRGRHETTWAVLRKFGYDDTLELCDEYLYPESIVQPQPPDIVPQLSENGKLFLTAVFEKFDMDRDGVLNQQELYDLFSVFPYQPWGHDVLSTVCTDANGSITLVGFLSQWMLTTYLDASRTLEHLAYLGYATLQGKLSQDDAITFVSGKVGGVGREIFTCKVIGAKGVGKSTFLQGLIRSEDEEDESGGGGGKKRPSSSVIAINRIKPRNRTDPVYLLLHEVEVSDLMAAGEGLFMCDVVCLLYDVTDADSFQPCAEAYRRFVSTSPEISCLVVATKSDRKPANKQRSLQQPDDFCLENQLPPPVPFSSHQHRDIYESLAAIAARPTPQIAHRESGSALLACLKAFAAIALGAAAGYGVYRFVEARKSKV